MVRGVKYLRALVLGILISGLIHACGALEEQSVGNVPLIKRFAATPNPIDPGGSAMLRWEVDGVDSVNVEPGIGAVPNEGSREVRPAVTTRYVLSVDTDTGVWGTSFELVVTGSTPEPSVPAPNPVPRTPQPQQTPTPIPTPTPTTTTAPTPAPNTSPDPSELVCEAESPQYFRSVVIQAQEQLKIAKPDWFDHETMPGWVIATKPESYFNAVIDIINTMDGGTFQAHPHFYEPRSHIAIKVNNDFSETYHIITSFHGLTNGYAFTCRPAEF